ncbi:MAG TPA: glyoxalase [Thermoplasmata archaeon]|nr:glyoxalase [Thermoplasmata archaeon]
MRRAAVRRKRRSPVRPTFLGLHHVQIAVPAGGEAAVREFYGNRLGLQEIPKPSNLAVRGGVWFRCGDQELHVGIDPKFASAWKFHPAFRVTRLSALRTRLTAAGIDVFDDLPLPRHRRFYALDPFGNRLEFVEPGRQSTRTTRASRGRRSAIGA